MMMPDFAPDALDPLGPVLERIPASATDVSVPTNVSRELAARASGRPRRARVTRMIGAGGERVGPAFGPRDR